MVRIKETIFTKKSVTIESFDFSSMNLVTTFENSLMAKISWQEFLWRLEDLLESVI